MSEIEIVPSSLLSVEEIEKRRERFRYVDLSHPLMQTLFSLQLDITHVYIPE